MIVYFRIQDIQDLCLEIDLASFLQSELFPNQ